MTVTVFWLAGGPGIGLGHLHRGLALSGFLGDVRFLVAPAARGELAALGVPGGAVLQGPEAIPQGARVVLDTLYHGNAARTAALVEGLRAGGHRVAVIDSMPPDHLDVTGPDRAPDLLITPYLGADRLRPAPACRWLAGAAFSVLPLAYAAARATMDPADAQSILVACGGADPSGLSVKIASECAAGPHPVDVVVGPQFDAATVAGLADLAARAPNIRLHHGLTSLVDLYLGAGLVIGRPGLIRYEAACLGRCGLYLWERPEYHDYFRAFNASGTAEIHLSEDPGGETVFLDRVRALATAPSLPAVPQAVPMAMVDGQGAARVAEAIRSMGEPT